MLKTKLDYFLRKFFIHKNEEIPSFLLHKLFHQGSYIPFTTSSLKFRLLACIANDIVVNNRNIILEFGSGISTIIIARLIKLNELNAKITSVDESQEWQEIIKTILTNEGLIDYVVFVTATTVKSDDISNSFEYNNDAIFNQINQTKFDLILVDGPSAWNESIKMSRAANFKFIQNNLSDKSSIFIDNSDRIGETELVNKIKNQLNLKPMFLDPTFIAFTKGEHFNFVI